MAKRVLRWTICPLVAVVALSSCSVSGERRAFAEQFELPAGYELVNHDEHRGELGKIGGGLVDITVAKPEATSSAEGAARHLCGELAGGAAIEHPLPEVPADWETCRFEAMEQRVLVGTSARFRGYNEVLAADACGSIRCGDDTLVVWIE